MNLLVSSPVPLRNFFGTIQYVFLPMLGYFVHKKLLLENQDGIKEQLRTKRSASITDPESPLWQAEAQEDDEQSEARTPPQMPKLYSLGKVRQPLPVPLANGSQKTTATPTQAAQRRQPVITSSVVDAGDGEDIEE
ncbi:hypothetical protein BGZ89_005616 [Linnemannia elongata]|nr:hypothetical protein BGZ89_005616 [Linnemannia elongata]